MLTGYTIGPSRSLLVSGRSGGIQTRVSGLKARNPGSLDDASPHISWSEWRELNPHLPGSLRDALSVELHSHGDLYRI